jgi:hypothetical protein
MLLKLMENHLGEQPAKICTTTAELADAMQGLAGKKICTYLAHHSGTTYFMYAEVEENNIINTGGAVALVAPCPPYCTKGGGENAGLYAWV